MDPRLNSLGHRGPVQRDEAHGTANSAPAQVDEDAYRKHRYRLGVAEGIDEIAQGKHCFAGWEQSLTSDAFLDLPS
jgi:hypothetical protein